MTYSYSYRLTLFNKKELLFSDWSHAVL